MKGPPSAVARVYRKLRRLAEPGFPTVRAAGWAVLALRRLRRQIGREGLEVRVLSPPTTVGVEGVGGVESALRICRATCLERCLIMQRWLLAHDDPHEILVGVTGGSEAMEAHAWLHSYDPDDSGRDFQLLTRVAPRT
jgi:hypothetical protein